MKHTPGPWFVVEGDEWTSNIATDTPEQGVWTVADANSRRAEFQANRRLIAAAPDLLEALRLCANVLAGHDMSKSAMTRALEKAAAAMTKATGADQIKGWE